jgi:cadmium resistance protein CadD (predicted permease)
MKGLHMQVGKYTKAIVTILAAGLGIFVFSNSDGVVTPVEYVNIGIALLTAVTTYLIPNLTGAVSKYAKTIVAFGGAALTALAILVAHSADWSGVSSNDWLGILLAGLAAIGVYILPNVTTRSVTNITVKTPSQGE